MKNQEIAVQFEEIADALELKGEIQFKVLAYRRAARSIEELTEDVAELAKSGKLREIPGIGEGTAKKIVEYLDTGKMKKLAEALEGLSEELLDLLKIPGLGPKTLALVHKELGVNNLADLKRVLSDGSLAGLPGMGEKKADNLRKGVEVREHASARLPLDQATEIADKVVAHMKLISEVKAITPAGSLRRSKETIGDIDILVTGKNPEQIVKHFTKYPEIVSVLSAGDTKASIRVKTGTHSVQVDLRVLPSSTFGAALQYFTGSKEHNVKLRTLASEKGLKISEYGVFRGEKRIAGATEKEVYATMKMPVIPPEIREDRGEIEAALRGKLPKLVELADIKGDLHVHTSRSDGSFTLEQMVEAAKAKGYAYVAITDHSPTAAYARGLSIDRLKQSIEDIDRLNVKMSKTDYHRDTEKLRGTQKKEKSADGHFTIHNSLFTILTGAEVDILPNGKPDYPDRILEQLDIVVASIHQSFRKNVTERICDALANPNVDIIGHPSGRLLSRREGYDVDLDKVLECARKCGKIIELNSYPDRLDLNDLYLRKAKEMGVRIAIDTDAHGIRDFDWMKYGVATARRGWLEKQDVVNCLSLNALLRLLRKN
jgi:DNA polymerase (family 10)